MEPGDQPVKEPKIRSHWRKNYVQAKFDFDFVWGLQFFKVSKNIILLRKQSRAKKNSKN